MKQRLHRLRAWASALSLALSGPALGQPAQVPLLSIDPSQGRPNVVFTLDDSGSMNWEFMPDSVFGFLPATNLPPGNDQWEWGIDPAQRGAAYPSARTRFVSTDANDSVAVRYRSRAVNRIYYNPSIRYLPWAFSDGSLMPDAPPTAAPVDPRDPTANLADLTSPRNVLEFWCGDWGCPLDAGSQVTRFYEPATYFDHVGGPLDDPASYTKVSINADAEPFLRPSSRDECAVAAGDPAMRECTRAQELQNFANWFTYARTRAFIAIGAASHAFSAQGDGLRVGFGSINNGINVVDGQSHGVLVRGVRRFDGVDRDAFFTWLHGTTQSGATPLRLAMDEIGRYFSRTDDAGPWGEIPGSSDSTPHLECRKSYHILMTDGYWNSAPADTADARLNVDGANGPTITGPDGQSYSYVPGPPFSDTAADTLADVAMYYWNRDLRPDLANRVVPDPENPAFWQQLVQFTVGLGVEGTLDPATALPGLVDGSTSWPVAAENSATAIDDLWHAAINARGRYLSANDPREFAGALARILNNISARQGAEGGAAVSSVRLQASNRKYVPTYSTARWSGDVEAQELDADGNFVAEAWRASQALPAWNARNLFVGQGGALGSTPLEWTSMTAAQLTAIGPSASPQLIDWLRGDRSLEGSTFRARAATSLLGDMVNSSPVLIAGLLDEQYRFLPSAVNGVATGRESYGSFLQAKAARSPVLAVGANDGFLHLFRESDGAELYGWMPRAVLPRVAQLSRPNYVHRFYVDGPLAEADAYVGGQWRNYLLGSLGAGGRAVFALDVTDTSALDASTARWEFTNAELGHVFAPVAVGLMANGRWGAVFGNGPFSASGNAQLFIVDLATGALIRRIDTGVGGGNGLGGVRLVRNHENVVVAAYAGDLRGNLWRFDLGSDAPASWSVGFGGNPLFVASSGSDLQPIMAEPDYVDHPEGGQLVVFGTGRLFMTADNADARLQSLYGVWDREPGHVPTLAGQQFGATDVLVTQAFTTSVSSGSTRFWQSTANPIDWSTDRGWRLDLTMVAGQRSLYAPQFVRGLMMFSTVVPPGASGVDCAASGAVGINVFVDALSGASPRRAILDTNADGVIDSTDDVVAAYESVADGSDRVMLGRDGMASIQSALGETKALLQGRGLERSWRQLTNFPR